MSRKTLRPLSVLDAIVKDAGLEVTYAYDDLAFIGHSEVLMQFVDSDDKEFVLFANREVDAQRRLELFERFQRISLKHKALVKYGGQFAQVEDRESREIRLDFFPEIVGES